MDDDRGQSDPSGEVLGDASCRPRGDSSTFRARLEQLLRELADTDEAQLVAGVVAYVRRELDEAREGA